MTFVLPRHYLQRQHRLRLRAHSAQVQKELEDDRRVLEELRAIEVAEQEANDEAKKAKKKEIEWMREVM